MDEAEIKKIVTKVLKQYNCEKFSFEESKAKDVHTISAVFALDKEYAAKTYEKLMDGVNFYGLGWFVGPLSMKDDGEYKIDFRKT